jgi:ATP diphosphatase
MSDTPSLDIVLSVIRSLLGPGGCPWDQKQTPLSLCDYVIEEGFELVEAIRKGPDAVDEAREEVGDVLFLLLFITELYERAGTFTLREVLESNAAKMVRRHPHVFEDVQFKDQKELLRNWERIKRAEKSGEGEAPARVFESLPRGLPPLLKSYRIHSKAARVGFTWPTDEEAKAQFDAEWKEWEEARRSGDAEAMEKEFGDVLFTLVELGRRQGIKASAALDRAANTFLSRFEDMEDMARTQGQDLADMEIGEMNLLWDQAKKNR